VAKAKEAADTADLLVGIKAICDFLRRSEATVLKWRREYDDFPVKKNGQLISTRAGLQKWVYNTFGG
jgi:hypothetical protein